MAQDTFVSPFTISSQALQSSGTTFAQLIAGGPKVLLDNLVAANPALANPTVAATMGSSVAAGGLAAGTYYARYSWLDVLGETLAPAASECTQFTSTGTSQLWTATIPALPTGAVSANIYVTPANGAAGTETLYGSGITTTTFALSYTPPADMPTASLPVVNSTGGTANYEAIYSLVPGMTGERTFYTLYNQVSNYLSAYPIERHDVIRQARLRTGVMAYWFQVYKEIESLIIANMPTSITQTTSPIGLPNFRWVGV